MFQLGAIDETEQKKNTKKKLVCKTPLNNHKL